MLKGPLKAYWPYQSALSVQEGIIMYGNRMLIPSSLRLEMLDRIHTGHQGIHKCRQLAKQSIWWPGMSQQIEDMVKSCRVCAENSNHKLEPLIPSETPTRPWQKLGTDLFEFRKSQYLLIVDYYSRFIEIAKLSSSTSSDVINHMKSIFARHGYPSMLVSDNGTQYASQEFAEFMREHKIQHITSSPTHSSGNGEAERAVRTVKNLLKGSVDPYAALLQYRATPLANGYSPAELLMSRRLQTGLPASSNVLMPTPPRHDIVKEREDDYKKKMKRNFDSRHAAHPLTPLEIGDEVFLKDREEKGVVTDNKHQRSFQVQTPSGTFRRNRFHLNKLPGSNIQPEPETLVSEAPPPVRCSSRKTKGISPKKFEIEG